MKIEKKRLTLVERKLIANWHSDGISNIEISKRLGRSKSTIGRELTRNVWKEEYYEPLHAQGQANRRKQKVYNAKHPLKNQDIYAYVLEKLRQGWSPEQIAGRLRKKHPANPYYHVHHETIYRFIYHPNNKSKRLWENLRRKQKRRRKKMGRVSQRVRIPDRVSIHKRPREIDKKKQVGHWEGDSIVGKGKTNGLHTEYERVCSYTRFERLVRINAIQTKLAMNKIFDPLPTKLKKSSTLDNGLEMAKHNEVNITCYFADPYASWQRGGNENANLWIRYYFPKGTDFSKITDEELRDVEWELNNRPRKRLNYSTPQEVFNIYLQGLQ